MTAWFEVRCLSCGKRSRRYASVKKCECGGEYERLYADTLNLGDVTIGHRKLVDVPLTKDDWAEVYRAYQAFQHHIRLIVNNVRERG